ncbi:hypothetical protein TNCV_4719451 [Trichonephila clavipes]|uniref:Uncharacterized protein n=1 Tax=Trichonephila clavipes TaxID=2585209 RepID=A0A8X6W662_TRICX|nr:hypothetical protein TNCV_4719451 [Trichonephila clavipes]
MGIWRVLGDTCNDFGDHVDEFGTLWILLETCRANFTLYDASRIFLQVSSRPINRDARRNEEVSEISGLGGFCLSEGSLAVGKDATYYNGKVLAVCETTMHLLSAGLTPAKVVFFIDSQSATLDLSSNTPTDCLYTFQFRT